MKKKQKDQKNHYIVYGINGCINILKTKTIQIISIHIMDSSFANKNSEIDKLTKEKKHLIKRFTKKQFLHRYPKNRSQGIVIEFLYSFRSILPKYKNRKGDICILVLDNLEDPQNFGQIIRTAECTGVDAILIPKHNSVGISDTVLQISQGGFTNVPIYISNNIRNDIKLLKNEGFWSVALENSIKGKRWHDVDLKGKIVIVIGGEGKGIRQLIMKECDFLVTIPMQGTINSLNVSAATSAILCERIRQIY